MSAIDQPTHKPTTIKKPAAITIAKTISQPSRSKPTDVHLVCHP
jgi:hypothetical protein